MKRVVARLPRQEDRVGQVDRAVDEHQDRAARGTVGVTIEHLLDVVRREAVPELRAVAEAVRHWSIFSSTAGSLITMLRRAANACRNLRDHPSYA